MTRLAWREIRRHPRRLVAVVLAVVISAGFLAAAVVFTATELNSVGQRLTAKTAGSDVVVELAGEQVPVALRTVAAQPGVDHVEPLWETYLPFSTAAGPGDLELTSLPLDPRLRWTGLREGSWPAAPDEIAISDGTARNYAVNLGGTIRVASGDGPARTLRVVGVTDESRSLMSVSSGLVAPTFFAAESASGTLLVLAVPSTTAEDLASAVRAAVPAEATVRTSAAVTADAWAEVANNVEIELLLLGFAAVALLVGTVTIANTFTVVLAGRRRTIALLRAVGATRAQVGRGVLVEASLVGAAGGVAGVGFGTGVAALGSTLSGSIQDGLVVVAWQLVAIVAVGVVATVLAAALPARRTARVAPVEALRPVAGVTEVRHTLRVRALVAVVLIALGTAVVSWGLTFGSREVLIAASGSLVLAAGIVVAVPLFLPPVLRGCSRAYGRLGATARLAGANLLRNPAQASATCLALTLAVGLVVTVQVGAASVGATVTADLRRSYPVDITVSAPEGRLDDGIRAGLAGTPGLRATTAVRTVRGDVGTATTPLPMTVAGLGADAGAVVAAGLEPLAAPGPTALASADTLEVLGLRPGDPLTARYRGQTATFAVVASQAAPEWTLVISAATLAGLAPRAAVTEVWAAAVDPRQAEEVLAGVRRVAATRPGLEVSGSLAVVDMFTTVLDTLLAVASGLLGVAVLIGLVGIGNTLSLSVLERSRESALLRALGLQRRRFRAVLAVEAVTLSGVAAVVGTVCGIGFGLLGAVAIAREADLGPVDLSVSVPQTLTVLGLALAAGVVASILPGRRAGRAAPVAALADA